jgi:hypothetical protein
MARLPNGLVPVGVRLPNFLNNRALSVTQHIGDLTGSEMILFHAGCKRSCATSRGCIPQRVEELNGSVAGEGIRIGG